MNALEIKRKRRELGLTQEDLSKKLGVSLKTISNYENGEVIPDTKQALLLEILSNNTVNDPAETYVKKANINFEEKRKLITEEIKQLEEVIKHKLEIIDLLRMKIEIITEAENDKKKKDY